MGLTANRRASPADAAAIAATAGSRVRTLAATDPAERNQIRVVTHSEPPAPAVPEEAGIRPRTGIKQDGATWVEGLRIVGSFREEE